jgi:PE family
MVFVTAQPESLTAAASRLAGIGSTLPAQNAATATPMTGWCPLHPDSHGGRWAGRHARDATCGDGRYG